MQVRAAVEFSVGPDGATRIDQLSCAPPLVLCETSAGLLMVGAAGGPLGGDEWSFRVSCKENTRARIGSVAATIAQPGRHDAESRFDVTVDLRAGAQLDWAPEPVVVSAGAVHRSTIGIELTATSRLQWRDVIVLGRHARPPGRSITRWRVRRAGRPLFAHDLDVGAGAPTGWDGPAVLACGRVVGSLLVVDPDLTSDDVVPVVPGATTYALAGPAYLVVAVGDTTVEVIAALDAASRIAAPV
jgi:urease accessory protein